MKKTFQFQVLLNGKPQNKNSEVLVTQTSFSAAMKLIADYADILILGPGRILSGQGGES